MSTVTDTSVTLILGTNTGNGAAGSTRASPGVASAWLDTKAAAPNNFDGGVVGLSIANGASAPGAPASIVAQWSPDNGTTVYDLAGFAGDIVANSNYSWTADVSPAMRYVRVIGFGNTTNPVTFGATYSGTARS